MLPEDPTMLFSYINMKLRDEFADLDDMCDTLDIDKNDLIEKLEKAGYRYDADNHCFK